MENLRLIYPSKKYKSQIEKYKKDLIESGSSMDGCGTLRNDDFETWLKKCDDWRKGENLPDGFVQSTQYICVRKPDDKLIGMFQIRHELNDFLYNFGGHIGYSVAVDERKKGYGKKQLEIGLKKSKKLGLEKVLVSCLDTHEGSKKCIVSNGGVYDDTRTIPDKNINLERYWIDLTK